MPGQADGRGHENDQEVAKAHRWKRFLRLPTASNLRFSDVINEIGKQAEEKNNHEGQWHQGDGVVDRLLIRQVHIVSSYQKCFDDSNEKDQRHGLSLRQDRRGGDGETDQADQPQPNDKVMTALRVGHVCLLLGQVKQRKNKNPNNIDQVPIQSRQLDTMTVVPEGAFQCLSP